MPHGEPFSPPTQRQCCDNWRKSPPCLPIPLLEAKTGLAIWRATASRPSTCQRTHDCCQRLRRTLKQPCRRARHRRVEVLVRSSFHKPLSSIKSRIAASECSKRDRLKVANG